MGALEEMMEAHGYTAEERAWVCDRLCVEQCYGAVGMLLDECVGVPVRLAGQAVIVDVRVSQGLASMWLVRGYPCTTFYSSGHDAYLDRGVDGRWSVSKDYGDKLLRELMEQLPAVEDFARECGLELT